MDHTKIKFYAVSIKWTEGGVMGFNIKASAGSIISISWGNGHIITYSFCSESERDFINDYSPGKIIPQYDGVKFLVEISCDNPDSRIIGFRVSSAGEMDAIDLDVTNCPELEELTYHGYLCTSPSRPLDLSHNTALKDLDCQMNSFTSLNLSHNTELENLNCRCNRLFHLCLTSNFALQILNCEYNKIEKLFIPSYALQLIEAKIEEGNQIDEATIMHIQELVEENINRMEC